MCWQSDTGPSIRQLGERAQVAYNLLCDVFIRDYCTLDLHLIVMRQHNQVTVSSLYTLASQSNERTVMSKR